MSLGVSLSYSPTTNKALDTEHTVAMYAQKKGFCSKHPSVRLFRISGGIYRTMHMIPCQMCLDDHEQSKKVRDLEIEEKRLKLKSHTDQPIIEELKAKIQELDQQIKQLEEIRAQYLNDQLKLFQLEKAEFERKEKDENDKLRIASLRTLLHGAEQLRMDSSSREYDYVIKLVLLGDSGVGKTSIIKRYCDENFTKHQRSTIGFDFQTKEFRNFIGTGRSAKIALWDTAGQERFRSLTSSYYRGAQGVILVFDITSRMTFQERLEEYMVNIQRFCAHAKILLVGNKLDLEEQRQVKREEAELWAKENGQMNYLETSAKDSTGVQKAIEIMCLEVLSGYAEKVLKPKDANARIQLPVGGSIEDGNKRKSSCMSSC